MANYQNDINMDLLTYLDKLLPYKEEHIKQRIRQMTFAEFLDMQNAYNEEDDGTLHMLFASLEEADNSYSTSSYDPPEKSVDDEKEQDFGQKFMSKLRKELDPASIEQKTKTITKKIGDLEHSYEEDIDLERLTKLAGVEETASGGATGAGAVASGPVSVGGMKRRENPSVYPVKKKKK